MNQYLQKSAGKPLTLRLLALADGKPLALPNGALGLAKGTQGFVWPIDLGREHYQKKGVLNKGPEIGMKSRTPAIRFCKQKRNPTRPLVWVVVTSFSRTAALKIDKKSRVVRSFALPVQALCYCMNMIYWLYLRFLARKRMPVAAATTRRPSWPWATQHFLTFEIYTRHAVDS